MSERILSVHQDKSHASGGNCCAGIDEEGGMKRFSLLWIFFLSSAVALPAQDSWAFKGTVVKMKMADCMPERGFRATMSGVPVLKQSCPQYTVLSSRVVYVLLGRHREEFMPLAEDVHFAIRKNEVWFFGGKEKVQSRFVVQQMLLRSDWDRQQELRELEKQKLERRVSYESRNPPQAAMVVSIPR